MNLLTYLPRRCLLVEGAGFHRFAGELIPRKPLANNLADGKVKALAVVHALAIVVPERLLVQIPEQMIRFDGNVRTAKRSLEQAPEILQSIGVNFTANILDSMVNHFVLKLAQSFIRFQRIGEERRTRQHVLTNFGLKGLLLPIWYNLGNDLAAALQDSHNGRLVFAASAGNLFRTLALVHVPRFAADKGFVRFDLAGQLVDGSHAQGVTDSMIHEPSGFLGHADGAVDFVGRYAVFAVHNLPHGHQPFVDTQRGILKDGSGLGGELAGVVAGAALPAVVLFQKRDALAATARAFNAIGPAARYQVLAAISWIREVYDGLLKGIEYGFHTQILSESV